MRLTLRSPDDLPALGPLIRTARRDAGFRSAREAAPLLGVTPRLLAEVERGMRTARGISLGRLLRILAGLGYELDIHPKTDPPPARAADTDARPARLVDRRPLKIRNAAARLRPLKIRNAAARPRPKKP